MSTAAGAVDWWTHTREWTRETDDDVDDESPRTWVKKPLGSAVNTACDTDHRRHDDRDDTTWYTPRSEYDDDAHLAPGVAGGGAPKGPE